jgi:multidrug resistance efflux pump
LSLKLVEAAVITAQEVTEDQAAVHRLDLQLPMAEKESQDRDTMAAMHQTGHTARVEVARVEVAGRLVEMNIQEMAELGKPRHSPEFH